MVKTTPHFVCPFGFVFTGRVSRTSGSPHTHCEAEDNVESSLPKTGISDMCPILPSFRTHTHTHAHMINKLIKKLQRNNLDT